MPSSHSRLSRANTRCGREERARHLKRLRKLLPAIETAETSPDPYRNIARDAYQLAQDLVLRSGNEPDESSLRLDQPKIPDKRKELIDRLATKLFDEAAQ